VRANYRGRRDSYFSISIVVWMEMSLPSVTSETSSCAKLRLDPAVPCSNGMKDFALGSTIVFPDQVITAFTFSLMGTTGSPGKSPPFGCGNVAANCAIRISNTLLKFSWFWTAAMKLFILLSMLPRILSLASNFLPTSELILS
jgi:hypothetical protein